MRGFPGFPGRQGLQGRQGIPGTKGLDAVLDPELRARLIRIENIGNLNYAQTGLVNNKLGDQLTGGIGGKLTRMSNWLKLPQVVNTLTLIVTLHNAAMLSSALAETLGSVLSTGLAAVGIKMKTAAQLMLTQSSVSRLASI